MRAHTRAHVFACTRVHVVCVQACARTCVHAVSALHARAHVCVEGTRAAAAPGWAPEQSVRVCMGCRVLAHTWLPGGRPHPCGHICPLLPQAPGSCRDPGRPSAVPSPGVGAFPGVSGVSLSPATPASESEPVAVVSGGTVAPWPGTAQSSRCPSPASVQRASEDSRGGRLEPGAAQPSVGLWLRSHCGAETCDRFGQGGGSVGVQSQLGTHLPCDPAASVVSGEGDSQGP